ncbi:MAG: hypothetical protein ACI4PC_00255 [Oscillospiraceae bacterium]
MIRYVRADPTGNITALVLSPVEEEQRARAAEAVMARDKSVEQVGFVTFPRGEGPVELTMAGGEFCGNASLSAAALYARRLGLARAAVTVCVRGAGVTAAVELEREPDGAYRGRVEMPLPLWVGPVALPVPGGRAQYPVAAFPGISHVIVTGGMSRQEAEVLARPWCAALDVPALGLMLLDPAEGRLSPLVYVAGGGTLFWENSCASGSAAVGAYLALSRGGGAFPLTQPGGVLTVEAALREGALASLAVRGRVRLGEEARTGDGE